MNALDKWYIAILVAVMYYFTYRQTFQLNKVFPT